MNPIRRVLLRLFIGRATVAHNVVTDGTQIELPFSNNYLIGHIEFLGEPEDPGCGHGCGPATFFVPEAGCPVHDPEDGPRKPIIVKAHDGPQEGDGREWG